jgi:predicted nuclease of restriction endonuclease-like (RecB) superfamily
MSEDLKITGSAIHESIRSILDEGRRRTGVQINSIMVETYWRIGERIVLEEQQGATRAEYGKFLLQALSRVLSAEFGKGFSYANLRNFRQFYLTWPDREKCYTLCSKLTWSHNRLIMREEDEAARLWYLGHAAEGNWTVRQLERQIKTRIFQRTLSVSTLLPTPSPTPESILKDPYVLEFLDLPEDSKTHERDLESALIDNLQAFLLELGRGFSFVGRQFRISSETSHFYIDLVFYNYLLKCFVLIDLKIDKLAHQDIGQMDMYVRMFDDLKRGEDDNPTLGIILCADKDETIVRYSVLSENAQLFAAKYLTILPSEEELARELEARHVFDIQMEETVSMNSELGTQNAEGKQLK